MKNQKRDEWAHDTEDPGELCTVAASIASIPQKFWTPCDEKLHTTELNRRSNGRRGAPIRSRKVPCTIEGERGVQLDTAPRADVLLPDSVRRVGDVISGHRVPESVVDGHVE